MKIVLWGTYDTSKPRIRILREGLRMQGVEVIELHASIWEDVQDKTSLRGVRAWLRRGFRLLANYPHLVRSYLRAPAHDLVLVSYPGPLDALVLHPFAWLRRTPLVFDWFISAYDTVVLDRRLFSRRNPLSFLLWACEWLAAWSADVTFMDTAAHARRMEQLFRLRQDSVGHVWVGAESALFMGATVTIAREPASSLRVLFYGQFIPLHGIDTIIEAARLTRDAPIAWTLIGHGQVASRLHDKLEREPLPKLKWIDWVPYAELRHWIIEADVCLGIFGTSQKAASVIPNKIFQIIAAGKPLITRDSPAIRELLSDSPPCVRLLAAGDPEALAAELRQRICDAEVTPLAHCHQHTAALIEPRAIAAQFLEIIESTLFKNGIP